MNAERRTKSEPPLFVLRSAFIVHRFPIFCYPQAMQIRPVAAADLDDLADIDGTIESTRYLHVDRNGEGLNLQWKIEDRPLRTKLIQSNPLNDDLRFTARQIATGADDGIALLVEHDERSVALMLAQLQPAYETLKLIDLRVDHEYRRQGLATGLMYQLIQTACDNALRAVAVETRTNHFPANQLMAKLDFQLAGIDTQRYTNHDLVKEAVTLFWYAALD
jgi:ribosomal protein S18 acetylase RimI-like enzyme